MSRRYGRKQRRAAQEAIAERDETLWHARQALLREGIRTGEIEREAMALKESIALWDDEIRGLLGPYTSFAITDTTYRIDSPDRIRQMPVMPPISMSAFLSPSFMPESLTYHVETMLSFIAGLEDGDRATLQKLMTLRVQIGSDSSDNRAYWALSDKTWHDLKNAGPQAWSRMTRRIAADLVRLLAQPPKPKASTSRHYERHKWSE